MGYVVVALFTDPDCHHFDGVLILPATDLRALVNAHSCAICDGSGNQRGWTMLDTLLELPDLRSARCRAEQLLEGQGRLDGVRTMELTVH